MMAETNRSTFRRSLAGSRALFTPQNNSETVTIDTAQSVGAIWLNRCTMPGRWRSTPMQVSLSSRWVTAAGYNGFTGGSWPWLGRENAGSLM